MQKKADHLYLKKWPSMGLNSVISSEMWDLSVRFKSTYGVNSHPTMGISDGKCTRSTVTILPSSTLKSGLRWLTNNGFDWRICSVARLSSRGISPSIQRIIQEIWFWVWSTLQVSMQVKQWHGPDFLYRVYSFHVSCFTFASPSMAEDVRKGKIVIGINYSN